MRELLLFRAARWDDIRIGNDYRRCRRRRRKEGGREWGKNKLIGLLTFLSDSCPLTSRSKNTRRTYTHTDEKRVDICRRVIGVVFLRMPTAVVVGISLCVTCVALTVPYESNIEAKGEREREEKKSINKLTCVPQAFSQQRRLLSVFPKKVSHRKSLV